MDPGPSPQQPGGRTTWTWLLAILLVTGLAYTPTLGNGFPYDDAHIAQARHPQRGANPMVAELQPVWDYFTTEYWHGAGAGKLHSNPLYRPVTVYSIALTHWLWPGDGSPAGEALPHHLGNLLLHLLNTLLVFALTRRCGAAARAGLLAAAVFGLGAIHSEAVASIVGRADLLAFGLGLAALLLLLAPSRNPWLHRGTAGLVLFLALCSKESALAFWPFAGCAAVALAMRSSSGNPLAALWRPLLFGVPPVLAWWWLRDAALAPLPAGDLVAYIANPLQYVELPQRILAGLAIQGYATAAIFAPLALASDYGAAVFPFAEPGYSLGLTGLGYLALWLLVFGLGILAARRRLALPFLACVSLLGFGMATSNLLVVIGTIHADRLSYLPSLGAALATAWLVQRCKRPAGLLAVTLWCAINGGLSYVRAGTWQDNPTLFLTDVVRQPDSLMLRLQAAAIEQQRGDWRAWQRHLEAARRLRPQWARPLIELAAGRIVSAQQRAPTSQPERRRFLRAELSAAEQMLRQASRATIRHADDDRRLGINLGTVLIQLGRPQPALRSFETVLAANPNDIQLCHTILINAADGLSDPHFLRLLSAAERHLPNAAVLQMHRGLRAARKSLWSEARRCLEAALPRIDGVDTQIHQAWLVLAAVRQRAGDTEASRELYRRIAADPEFPVKIRRQAAALNR